MTHKTQGRHALDDGRWVRVRLPNGRPAMVATRYDHRGRVVVVKPIQQGRKNGTVPPQG